MYKPVSESASRRVRRVARHKIRSFVRELLLLPRFVRFRLSGWLLRRELFNLSSLASPEVRRKFERAGLRQFHGPESSPSPSRGLLEGKSVAIVGPCVGPDQESEINEYQFVARISHNVNSGYPHGSGTRCEIAYYAGWKLIQMNADGSLVPSLKSLALVVVRKRKLVSKLVGKEFLHRVFEACDTGLDQSFYPVKPNAIPQLVAFALTCGASRVKIFNVDLFTGHYANSYLRSSLHPRNVSLESLALHNPFTHLKYFRRLMLDPRVSVDEVLKAVLDKSSQEYAKALRGRP